ncbi:thiamine pyrophosphate-dependent dehydrogenase E1 component subunit alpha [Fervidicoccus fontis]|uniref:2-oxoacid oxidoreductase (ferredoxin) n=1 Tax=Fervidicoccus fontis (strain DSM 19380 / JCM 18336 / VKM B-2539 / Kam940) TaxID=1163730 RepID=I0A1L5_FERFK|nr:thiamine pyrophosphate-dependent dehydrogenase E1 component subunit alpha [Fervidicoccus fontis]AFH42872.1 Pyruvate dehydrogenase (acetyl-transferring) [Fervidicoccus fontis Kam940]
MLLSEIPKEKILWMYKTMLLIRKNEEAVEKYYRIGKIPGSLHLYIGEEAVAVGVVANLNREDVITSTHRGHGHFLAKGGSLKKLWAELLGKRTGACKGKGGSMHLFDFENCNLGSNGIVGGGIPHAVGAALSFKLSESKNVAVSFFGEGATNQQNFHEGLNLASIWKLPVIFVCENNQYQISLHYSKQQAIEGVAKRGISYGIPAVEVDGQDVVAVYEVVKRAVERARSREGPTLIEAKTYRFTGHTIDDNELYRNRDEVEWWKKNKDPLAIFERKIIEEKIFGKEVLEKIAEDVEKEIEETIKFAEESPYPEPEELFEDLYSTKTKGTLIWNWE